MVWEFLIEVDIDSLPHLFTVSSFRGETVYKRITTERLFRVCVETPLKKVVASVSPLYGYANYPKRYLKADNCIYHCQRLYFAPSGNIGARQDIYLNDLEYGFPIISAKLIFSK